MKIIEEQEIKLADLKCIIDELEHNIGFKKLVELVQDEEKNLDATWHLIPEENSGARLQARASKMASQHLVNILEYIKSDIENTKKVIAELKSEELA